MFISAAGRLTPEAQTRLKPLFEGFSLTLEQAQLVEQMLGLRQLPNGPSIAEIAQTSDLSAQAVGRLDRAAHATAQTNRFKSVFISYGGPDEPFARKLYEALLGKGVHAYYFPDSAVPGRRLHRTMSDAVYEYDMIISVCSEAAVTRHGWLNELEQTLAREAREGGTELLIPVLLDDFVLQNWKPDRVDLARQLQSRVAADFAKHIDEGVFERQVNRLLAALAA